MHNKKPDLSLTGSACGKWPRSAQAGCPDDGPADEFSNAAAHPAKAILRARLNDPRGRVVAERAKFL